MTTHIPNTDYRYWILCATHHYSKRDRCGVPNVKTIEVKMSGGKRPRFQWRELNGRGFWQGKRRLEGLVKLGYKFCPTTLLDSAGWGKIIHE